jgi:hypothetical protein
MSGSLVSHHSYQFQKHPLDISHILILCVGSSSGFSIFSPKGLEWISEKTGDDSFLKLIQIDNYPSHPGKCEAFGDIFQRRSKHPLPSKKVARMLVEGMSRKPYSALVINGLIDFFRRFNTLYPLFHPPSFYNFFEKQYSDEPPSHNGWYSAFNMVLAVACRLRVSTSLGPRNIDDENSVSSQEAWNYFQNAGVNLTDLLMRNTDLISIQAIITMALFLQGTANPQPSYFLVAAAARIAISIGMHRKGSCFRMSAVEVEQRKRIFWIVYLLDKEYALRAGRPPCINDDDCNVELPSENPEDQVGNVTCSDGKVTFNIFRVMVTFATIQSKVYMQLYSAKAARQSDGELLNIVGNLDSELEAWKATIPSEFHPDKDLSWLVDRTIAYQILVLHFEYYSLLTTIHRMSIHHGYWTSRLSNYAVSGMSARRLNPRIFSSASLCVSAARSTVGLIKCLDSYDYPCLWLMLYYPISSLVTLFSNIVQNPQDPRARSDLGLIGASLDFFRLISKVDELDSCSLLHVDGSYRRVFMLCGEFERIARQVLDKTEKELLSKRKRKSQPNPSPSHAQRRQPQDQDQEPQGPGTANSSTFTWSPETNVFTPPDSQSTITNDSVFPIEHNLNPQHCQPFPEPNSFSWPINNFDSPPVTTNDHSMPLVAPSSFEQPFVPQDLWQIPMAFEWDWADLSGSAPTPWDCTYCAL